jgi:hypothetical protein
LCAGDHATKPPDLRRGKIADGVDLFLFEQRSHRFRGRLDRRQRVGPVDLVYVDIVGPQPSQGIKIVLPDRIVLDRNGAKERGIDTHDGRPFGLLRMRTELIDEPAAVETSRSAKSNGAEPIDFPSIGV